MNKINISFMTEEALETIKQNAEQVTKYLQKEKQNADWLKLVYQGNPFEELNYKIPDFTLLTDEENYKNVDYKNSIILYESLKELPRYILTDERFWLWILFTKGYQAALEAMPIKTSTTFKQHWLFEEGKRRGLFFNVLARCYLRVELSVNENLEDKFELTKFIIEKPERFRSLSWRLDTNNKNIVLATIKAEKDAREKFIHDCNIDIDQINYGTTNVYTEVGKALSLYGSVRIKDMASFDEIYHLVFDKIENLVAKEMSSNNS